MKIGFVVDNEFNGDARVIREARVLTAAGHQVLILCFGYGDKQYPAVDDFDITRVGINRNYKNFLFLLLNFFPLYEWLWASWIKNFIIKNKIEPLVISETLTIALELENDPNTIPSFVT